MNWQKGIGRDGKEKNVWEVELPRNRLRCCRLGNASIHDHSGTGDCLRVRSLTCTLIAPGRLVLLKQSKLINIPFPQCSMPGGAPWWKHCGYRSFARELSGTG